MKKTTTNPAPVPMTRAQIHAARAAAARSRHAVELPAVIILPRWTASAGLELIRAGYRDAAVDLRARRRDGNEGGQLMDELLRDIHEDASRDTLHDMVIMADNYRRTAARMRGQADTLQAIADRVSTPAEQATAAREQAEKLRDAAHTHSTNAAAIDRKSVV